MQVARNRLDLNSDYPGQPKPAAGSRFPLFLDQTRSPVPASIYGMSARPQIAFSAICKDFS